MNTQMMTPAVHSNGNHNDPGTLGELTPTGWIAPRQMTFDQWAEFGYVLGRIAGSVNWWVGDWLNEGEIRYGETYAQASDVIGWPVERLTNVKYVACHVPRPQRNPNLPWSRHKVVAPLPADEQVEWLARSEKEGLNTHKLGEAIRESQGRPLPINPCRQSQEWLQAIGDGERCMALAVEQGWTERGRYAYDGEAWLAAAVYLSKRFNYMALRIGEE